MNFSRFASALARLPILFIAVLCPYVACADESVQSYDIEAQPMDRALKAFAAQTEIQVAFAPETVEGLVAQAVEGDFVPESALQALIDESGLDYEFASERLVVVHAPHSNDQGGASDSKNLTPQPVLMAQNQTSQIRTTVSSSDDEKEVQKENSNEPLEEIIVTGTNIRGVENPTVLVLTFDRNDIDLSGAGTVGEFLRSIPQNFSATTDLSVESGNPNDGANVSQGSTVDLRGLGAGSTLTLLNGRRMAPAGISNFVDLSALPLGVVERVDILSDGATAIYGSDAIGGVVNFITRDDYEGFDVSASYGQVTDGSKENFNVGAAGGTAWNSGNFFVGVEYQESTPLLISERDFVDPLLPQEGARFGSEFDRISVSSGLSQRLSEKVRLGADILFSSRTSENNSIATTIPEVNESVLDGLFVNTRLEFDVSRNLVAELFFDYAETTVENESEFSTGLMNFAEFKNEMTVVEARFSGNLFNLPAGDVSFSFGGLYRGEEYDTNQNDFVEISAERDIAAVYVETLVPIVGEAKAIPFVQRIDLSLAGRYEDYSDVGDSFDAKIGAVWQVTGGLTVRGSYAESFRAPDLNAINRSRSAAVSLQPLAGITAFVPPPASDFALPFPFPDFALFVFPSGGNPNLEPETAKSWSAGFSYEPESIPGLTVRANYFNIAYEDRIEGVSITDPFLDPAFISLVNANPTLAEVEEFFSIAEAAGSPLGAFFGVQPEDIQLIINSGLQNVAERDIEGVDFIVSFERQTEIGLFAASLNSSYMSKYEVRLTETADATDQVDTLYRPVQVRTRAQLSWSKNGLTAFGALNHANEYRDNIDSTVSNNISSWTTVDLAIAYDTSLRGGSGLFDDVRIGFNVTNVFDEYPPYVETPFGLNYDTANADPFGRQISVSLAKRF